MRTRVVRPSQITLKRRKKASRKFLFFVFSLIVLYFGIGLLSHLPNLVINEVEIRNTKILNKDETAAKVLAFLDGNKALVYSRGSIFLFSKKDVSANLVENFPRIYEVRNIERSGQKLLIDIEERAPAYLWCGKTAPAYPDRFKKENCYFADQTGFIFDKSPYFTKGVYLTFYGGVESENPVGANISVKSDFRDFKNLAEKMEKVGFPITSVVLLENSQGELLSKFPSGTGDYQKVLFDENLGLADILRKVGIAFSEEDFQKDFSQKPDKLLYIDTRFKDKVFYKFSE